MNIPLLKSTHNVAGVEITDYDLELGEGVDRMFVEEEQFFDSWDFPVQLV